MLFEKKDFERVLTAARTPFADNEVTTNTESGGSNTMQSIELVQKAAIRRNVVDQCFVEEARGR